MSQHCCFLVSCHQDFLMSCCLCLILGRVPRLQLHGSWGLLTGSCPPPHNCCPSPPACCCWALCSRDEGSNQAVLADLSSLRWSMSCSAALENCEQSAKAWRRQWDAAEAWMGDRACLCMWLSTDGHQGPFCSESSHFHIPGYPCHFLNCMPPGRQAVTYSAVLWQILFVRTVKETDLSAR